MNMNPFNDCPEDCMSACGECYLPIRKYREEHEKYKLTPMRKKKILELCEACLDADTDTAADVHLNINQSVELVEILIYDQGYKAGVKPKRSYTYYAGEVSHNFETEIEGMINSVSSIPRLAAGD